MVFGNHFSRRIHSTKSLKDPELIDLSNGVSVGVFFLLKFRSDYRSDDTPLQSTEA